MAKASRSRTAQHAADGAPTRVYAVVEFSACSCEEGQYSRGSSVVALYQSKQTAKQHAERDHLMVIPMDVRTGLSPY